MEERPSLSSPCQGIIQRGTCSPYHVMGVWGGRASRSSPGHMVPGACLPPTAQDMGLHPVGALQVVREATTSGRVRALPFCRKSSQLRKLVGCRLRVPHPQLGSNSQGPSELELDSAGSRDDAFLRASSQRHGQGRPRSPVGSQSLHWVKAGSCPWVGAGRRGHPEGAVPWCRMHCQSRAE